MKLKKHLLTAAMLACMTTAVTPAVPVFAATAETGKEQREHGKDFLAELVENGSLSQETYENITAYMEANRPEKPEKAEGDAAAADTKADAAKGDGVKAQKQGGKHGAGRGMMLSTEMLAALLEADVITSSEYSALEAAVSGTEKASLTTLVENGTISQTTVDAIQAYLKENRPEKPENEETSSDSKTRPERPADDDAQGAGKGMSGKGGMHGGGDMFAKLLEADVITEAEYEVILAAMPERKAPEKVSE